MEGAVYTLDMWIKKAWQVNGYLSGWLTPKKPDVMKHKCQNLQHGIFYLTQFSPSAQLTSDTNLLRTGNCKVIPVKITLRRFT